MALSALFSFGIKAQTVSGVSLDRQSVLLHLNGETALEAIISPASLSHGLILWTISDRSVVDSVSVVNNVCTIRGVGVGVAKISVMTDEGNFTDTCLVTVMNLADSLRLSDTSLDLTLGHDATLVSKMFPPDAVNGELFWASGDDAVVGIVSVRHDSICTVRALRQGVATVYVRLADGTAYDSCLVTVRALPVTDLRLSRDSIKGMHMNSEATVTARVEPFGEANDSVRWRSSDRSIIQITSSGYDTVCTVRAVGIGRAYLYAEAVADGSMKDSCFVSVDSVHVERLSLSTDSLDLMINTDMALLATVAPFDATNDSVRWISRDSSIVDIVTAVSERHGATCLIMGVGAGRTTVVAEAFDGGAKDSCVVTVIVPTDSVAVFPAAVAHLTVDSTVVLTARVYPDSATYKAKTEWVNVNPSATEMAVLTDTTCLITALRAGVDTVYAVTADGVKSAFCLVSVDPRPADSVRIVNKPSPDNDTLLLNVNGSFELVTRVFPANVTNDTLVISSSDPDVARIDSIAGAVYIRALKDGTATVFVTATDGSGEKDSCTVKVRSVPAMGIRLDKDTLYLYKDTVGVLIVSVSPDDATDKSVRWRADRPGRVEVISTDVDSVYLVRGLATDTVLLHAYPGDVAAADQGIKDSCVVIVKERLIRVESDTASLGDIDDGRIKVWLKIPDDATVAGSFVLRLPKGFGLARKADGGFKSKLADGFSDISELKVTAYNDSTYVFDIALVPASLSSSSISMKEVLDIAYTIYDNTLESSKAVYDAEFVDVGFVVINSESKYEIKEEHIATEVKIKAYRDPDGNEAVKGKGSVFAYFRDNRLYVNTDKAEIVYVYLLNGSAVMTKEKTEGVAVFDVDVREKILIVRGSSGWAQKVISR